MIVLSDADIERAANFATYYSMQNAGQTCISIERVYVEEPVYDEFVAKVAEKVRALRVGKPEGGPARSRSGRSPSRRSSTSSRTTSPTPSQKGARVLAGGNEAGRSRPLLRADGPRRRRPHDEVHDRGDVRADAADHEGRATPTRPCAWPTTRTTASAPRCSRRTPRGRGDRTAPGGGSGQRQRRDDQLHGARAADGRREGLGPRLAPRRGRHPQVLLPAGDRRDAKIGMKKELFMYPYKSRTSKLLAGLPQAALRQGQEGVGARAVVRRRAAAAPAGRLDCVAETGCRASRSSSGIVVSALVWWTAAMPSSSAGVRLKGRSSTNTHACAMAPARSAPSSYIRHAGLRMPSSPEMTTPSKSSSNMSWRVAVNAPGVRHERRADARRVRAMRTA